MGGRPRWACVQPKFTEGVRSQDGRWRAGVKASSVVLCLDRFSAFPLHATVQGVSFRLWAMTRPRVGREVIYKVMVSS